MFRLGFLFFHLVITTLYPFCSATDRPALRVEFVNRKDSRLCQLASFSLQAVSVTFAGPSSNAYLVNMSGVSLVSFYVGDGKIGSTIDLQYFETSKREPKAKDECQPKISTRSLLHECFPSSSFVVICQSSAEFHPPS